MLNHLIPIGMMLSTVIVVKTWMRILRLPSVTISDTLAHAHEHEITNETFYDDWWRDIRLYHCSKHQSFDVSTGSNTA